MTNEDRRKLDCKLDAIEEELVRNIETGLDAGWHISSIAEFAQVYRDLRIGRASK